MLRQPRARSAACRCGIPASHGAATVTRPATSISVASATRAGPCCRRCPRRAPLQVSGTIAGSVPAPKASISSAPWRALDCSHAASSTVADSPQGSQPHSIPPASRPAWPPGGRCFCSGESQRFQMIPGARRKASRPLRSNSRSAAMISTMPAAARAASESAGNCATVTMPWPMPPAIAPAMP